MLNLPYSATSLAHYGVLPEESTLADPAPGTSIARRFKLTLDRCKFIAQRSCVEFEPESMPRLPEIFGKPVIPLGLLPPPPVGGGHGPGTHAEAVGQHDDTTVSWLDMQPPKSVVYVAFGSELPLTVEQLHELALGLELAGTRFLWALRKPHGVLDADILPPGFEERTHGRGLVAMGWVPQVKILAHSAVGAFLMHCGWSSVIEGLRFGHPLIMLPFLLDHWPTARNLERIRKVGLQVPRDEKDGSFDRDGVARTVRAVVVEEEGRKVFVANAKKLQEVVADRECNERCIDGFIEHLRSYKE